MLKKSRRRCERRFRKHFKNFLHKLNIAITIRKRNEFMKIKKLNIAMMLIMRYEFENEKKAISNAIKRLHFELNAKRIHDIHFIKYHDFF